MTVSNSKGSLLPPNQDFAITSNYFIDKIQPEKWTLVSDSIKQDFTAKISENNPYEIQVKSAFKEGKKYSLTIPKKTAYSFFESNKESKRFDFESDKIENYGDLLVTLENEPKQKFWIQLLSESGVIAYSKYGLEKQITFKSLKPGQYNLRILVDENENGIWDFADFADTIFAEPLFIFEKKIEVRPLWEIRETWKLPTESSEEPKEILPEIPSNTANPK